jgi:hypothetical protein
VFAQITTPQITTGDNLKGIFLRDTKKGLRDIKNFDPDDEKLDFAQKIRLSVSDIYIFH